MSHATDSSHTATYRVRLGDRGRVVLPARLRREIGLVEGDELLLTVEGGAIRLVSRRERARAARGIFKDLLSGRSAADELIAERRAEAAAEEAEVRAQEARRGR